MRAMTKRFVLAAAVLGLVIGVAGRAEADLATYMETGVGSGSLDGTAFTDVPFTLVATADTNNVTGGPPIFSVPNDALTVAVSGITATFTIPTITVSNQGVPDAGFGAPLQNLAVLFVGSSVFSSYDLRSSIGPISGTPLFNPGAAFATTDGSFVLTAVSSVTFQATVGGTPIPELDPGALASALALASGGLAVLTGRRRAAA